jgi:flagellar hook-basal body complex protein FliE
MNGIGGIGSLDLSIGGGAKKTAESGGEGFKDMLTNAVAEADNLYAVTQQDTQALLSGEVDDVAQVMINSTKSEVALNLVIQVRNKVVEAYQEIMRMQV